MVTFPSGHRFPTRRSTRLAAGPKEHSAIPAALALKLAGLRFVFDFSLPGVPLKTPPVLARKLEEIQCHIGEQTNNSSLTRSRSRLFTSCWAGGADCLLIEETMAVNPKREQHQAQRTPT